MKQFLIGVDNGNLSGKQSTSSDFTVMTWRLLAPLRVYMLVI